LKAQDVAIRPEDNTSRLHDLEASFQIGRPETGDFDAVCFDLNIQKQNREYRIVQANHEEILCNFRVKISQGTVAFVPQTRRASAFIKAVVPD
jgi:hypothetical protein